ncbi:peptidylprolyl isomerase [Acuticoccus sp. I52.16.1]|uniref:peptidylprolyl isomerase n=1 Tax=Acuticoccus sp. I52.16.1 TaxID=2928472 RepID=UPI001FD53EFA|nr:peptidylprolyl isomerase [Acuticoccus sp. I52.16.1]UOM33266.1 SurA N-terminal domain-containing protein [Acuticoccus sp. I52.16.1]
MLNALRRGAKGPFAKILIAVLVLSFAVWGVSGVVNTTNVSEVARVGDTPVTAREFERAWRLQSIRISQQLGRALTPEEIQNFGLANSVLQSLVTEALQVDAARTIGIDVGDETLAEQLRTDPRFAAGGRFDRNAFNRYLANFGYSENEFIEIERDATVQEMWTNSLLGGMQAPTPYLEAVNRFTNQTREVATFRLTDANLATIADPTEEQLQAYYDEHKDEFRAPERRSFTTVTLSPQLLAEPDVVDADAVRRAYETDGAYGEPEMRRVQQVVLDDAELAQKAADAINEGYAFAAILRQLDKKRADVDLGLVTKSAIFNKAVADAAFQLEARKATVVDGRFGPTLVRVEEIQEAAKQPFEEVEADIREQLALDEAMDQARALQTDVTDAVAGGAPVSEIAERFDLPLQTVEAVTAGGVGLDGQTVDVTGGDTVLGAAFRAEAGDDAAPVEDGDATIWVQVDTIIEADVRPFGEAQTDVLFAWTEAERARQLDELASAAVDAVNEGTPIEDVAAEYDAQVARSDPFTFNEAPGELPQAVATAAFEGPVGHAASVADGDSRIVLEVAAVSEPAFFAEDQALSQVRQRLDEDLANAVLLDFLNAWQTEVGATVNQPILDQITGVAQRQG